MTTSTRKRIMTGAPADRCDTRVWSGECQGTGDDKYLCPVCGTINKLDHEMHHEGFPHVTGDADNLS